MGLHELTLRNFRLFHEYRFHPDHTAVTVFLSPNGTGKSSVLEAVYALATASSFRTNSAADMVRAGETGAEVHGVLFHQDRRVQVDLTLTRGVRSTQKRMLINGQRPQSRAELAEALPLTVFTPEGVEVIRNGPEQRREFLNHLMNDVDPTTSPLLERFARVLSQRNAVLRRIQGRRATTSERDEIEVWTSDLAGTGLELVGERESLLKDLEPLVNQYYRALADDGQPVALGYDRSWSGDLLDALRRSFEDDVARGHSTRGPHRDDILVTLNHRDARRQASQGEQRSLALALRLAGHELVQQRRGVDPLLLLDDVFSELDPVRSDRLLQLLPAGQTLVTTAMPLPTKMKPASIIDLTNGRE